MNPNVINALAHQLAHEFVCEHFENLNASLYDDARPQLTFNVELWLFTTATLVTVERGITLVNVAKQRCNDYYKNDFAHPSHDVETRLDITQSLGYALLQMAGRQYESPEWNMLSAWYDAASVGCRQFRKYANGIGNPISL